MPRGKRERQYRGIFITTDGSHIGLDFYADNIGFARDHALQVANDLVTHKEQGVLRLVRVYGMDNDPAFRTGDAGSWFPLVEPRNYQ